MKESAINGGEIMPLLDKSVYLQQQIPNKNLEYNMFSVSKDKSQMA